MLKHISSYRAEPETMTFKIDKSRKMTVPERLRRERSPTALKEAAETGGLSNPHKGKGATRLKH